MSQARTKWKGPGVALTKVIHLNSDNFNDRLSNKYAEQRKKNKFRK